MKLSEAATVMKGGLRGEDAYFYGASSDTRQLKPGELFFAWEGENADAHQFLDSAEANGAIAAVVERYISSSEMAQIQVENSQRSLGLLAKAWRQRWRGTLIALTGSNGKTTLKEMISGILSCEAETLATEGNYNNHVGCPLTLLRLNENHQYGVIEMGANHPDEIRYLTQLALPDIAIINNAGACHLEGFGTIEGVARAKAEIFEGLGGEGIAIINRDDPHFEMWRHCLQHENRRYLTFGLSEEADCFASEIEGSTFTLHYGGEEATLTLKLMGQHNILNALAAATAALALKIPLQQVVAGLSQLLPVSGRLERIALTPTVDLINDGYNANPNSLQAGIDALDGEERWLILGDMGELGDERLQLHFEAGQYAKEHHITQLFGLGSLAAESVKGFGAGAEHYSSRQALVEGVNRALAEFMQSTPDRHLTILVKGSNSMNMPAIIEQLVG